jgi:hypothetical protein
MQCPCCKYKPTRNKSGQVRKGWKEWGRVSISHDFKMDYTSSHSFVAFVCPSCGVLFQKLTEDA